MPTAYQASLPARFYSFATLPEKAIHYDEQALAIAREKKDNHYEAYVLDHIGVLYSKLNQNQKALDYFGAGAGGRPRLAGLGHSNSLPPILLVISCSAAV